MRFLKRLAFVVVFLFVVHPGLMNAADEKAALEKKRDELRGKGFKTDVSDFNFSASGDEFTRSSTIKAAEPIMWAQVDGGHVTQVLGSLSSRQIITSNTALVVWDKETISQQNVESPVTWKSLREFFDDSATKLDSVAQALASGRYAFDLNAKMGGGMLLPHLAPMKTVAQAFATRAMLDLHDHHPAAAWSNVLTATRLATRWRVEPVEVSHLVQCGIANIASEAVWQVLQTNGWSDEQLRTLQKEWESVDWFAGFDECIAFQAASAAQMCQMERTNSDGGNFPIAQALRHPTQAVQDLKYYQEKRDYIAHGSYDDERVLLEFYFNREQELRRALQSKTWIEMRVFAASWTNMPAVQSKRSTMRLHLNVMAMGRLGGGVDVTSRSPLGRVAQMEAERRVLVTALALERFRLKNKVYPEQLAQLAPEFVASEPIDFCDGKPLRYRRQGERFVLYSVGLDGVDNGGVVPVKTRNRDYSSRTNVVAQPEDLVWLFPAAAKDMAEKERNEAIAAKREMEDRQLRWAEMKKTREAESQELRKRLAKVYAEQKPRKLEDPQVQGAPLSEVVRNQATANAKTSLYDLLTLRKVHTGFEPECVGYELPISYDVFRRSFGELKLLVDSPESLEEKPTRTHQLAEFGELQEWRRATNGNCLLIWNTVYDPPGKHFVQAELTCYKLTDRHAPDDFRGPLVMYESTNLCEFDGAYSQPVNGEVILWAKLAEPKGTASVELKTTAGEHIKTLSGSTTNSEIRIKWDGLDERGRKCTNETVDTFFTIKLPDSGRKQTLRGP